VHRWAFANGVNSTGMNLGTVIAPLLIVSLAERFGWQAAMLATAVRWRCCGAVGLVRARYAARAPESQRARTRRARRGRQRAVRPLTAARLRAIVVDRNVLLLALSYICMNYLFTCSELVIHLSRAGAPLECARQRRARHAAADRCRHRRRRRRWVCDRLAQRFVCAGLPHRPLVTLPLAGLLLLVAVRAESAGFATATLALAYACVEFNEGAYWAATTAVGRADAMAATGC